MCNEWLLFKFYLKKSTSTIKKPVVIIKVNKMYYSMTFQKCSKKRITLLVTVLIARVGEALPEIIHSIPKESESMLYGVEA